MSLPITIRPEAEANIEDAYWWDEEQREGLGTAFLLTLDAALALIGRQPELHSIQYRKARRAPLPRFLYSIICVLQRDRIDVFACFHSSRDPHRWRERL